VYTWNGATTIINDDDQGLRSRSLSLRLEAFSRPISLGFVSHGLANASVSVLVSVSESDIGPRHPRAIIIILMMMMMNFWNA